MTAGIVQRSLFSLMKLFLISILSGVLFLCSNQVIKAQEKLQDLYYSGNYNNVIEQTSEAIASGDTAFNTYHLKALSEVQVGKVKDAILTLELSQKLFPDNIRISRMLAGQYFDAGDYVKAWDQYNKLVLDDSTDAASWLKLAEIASFRQLYKKAMNALEQVLLIDSLNLNSLMMMGDILNRHNNGGAVVHYERAYSIYPDNQKAAYALGNRYVHAQKARETILICEHMLEIDPESIKFRKLMGYAYYKTGDPLPAITHFDYAIDLGDSTAFIFKFKGISHYLAVNFQGAIESLQVATSKDSMDAEIHFFLGASLGTTTQKLKAMYHLDQSLEIMKPDPAVTSRIYSEQGNILRLEMKHEKAYKLYSLAWEADSTNPISLYFMASILDNSLHLSKEALVDYQRYLDELDRLPEIETKNSQAPTIRAIVEDRIISLNEELFFLDEKNRAN